MIPKIDDKKYWNQHFHKLSTKNTAMVGKNIVVKFVERGQEDSVAYTRMGTSKFANVYLNPFHSYAPKNVAECTKFVDGLDFHEIGHQMYTDFDAFENFCNDLSYKGFSRTKIALFQRIWNAVEDPSIEFWDFQNFGGSMPQALEFTIAYIFKQTPNIESSDDAFGQFFNALIMYGDVGLLKGRFTKPEAREYFLKVQPIFDKAIEEPNCKKRIDIAFEIFNICEPLWKELIKEQEMIEEFLKEHKMSTGSGTGECSDDASLSSGSDGERTDKRKSRRMKTIEMTRKEFEEMMKDSSEGDGDGEEVLVKIIDDEPDDTDKSSGDSKSDGSDGESGDSSSDGSDGEPGDSSSSGSKSDGSEDSKSDGSEDSKSDGSEDSKSDGPASSTDDSMGSGSDNSGSESDTPISSSDSKKYGSSDDITEEEYARELEDAYEEAHLTSDDLDKIITEIENDMLDISKETSESKTFDATIPDFDISSPLFAKKNCRCQNIDVKVDHSDDRIINAYNDIKESMHSEITLLADKFNRIIRSDVESKTARTTGRVNINRLASGKRTARMFDKRIVPDKADMAVMLVLDQSGSMRRRYKSVMVASIAISEALAKVRNANIPFYCFGFTGDIDGYDAVHHHYIKWKNTREARFSLLNIDALYENFDGYSIRYATKLLEKRPESKKLMIVISDGQPACRNYYGKNGIQDTINAVRQANKQCTVVGVSVGGSDIEILQSIYGRNFIENKDLSTLMNDLGKILVKTLKD